MILYFLRKKYKDVSCDIFFSFFFIKMVHKRSEKKLQERKDKSFAKRKKVSEHSNCLEWLFGLPIVFQIFFDGYFYIFSFFYIYIYFFFFFWWVFFIGHVIFVLCFFLFFLYF